MDIFADIGGTKMRMTSDPRGHCNAAIGCTPQSYNEGLEIIIEWARDIAFGRKIHNVVVGVPSRLSKDKRALVDPTNLPAWTGKDLARDLERALNARVYLENDTALVGLGEAHQHPTVRHSIIAYITVSSGVNGVRIVDGVIDRSANGFEIGRQCIGVGNSLHTLESIVSGKAIEERSGVPPQAIDAGAPIWELLAAYVAIGVHNTIAYWSPNLIILGGSMFNAPGIPIDRVIHHARSITRAGEVPPIVPAKCGHAGGLIGGKIYLRHAKKKASQ